MTETDQTDDLAVQHLPLVTYEVRAFVGRLPAWVDLADLRSAGCLALVKASRSYDPSTGVPFARYAALRIRGAILDELRAMDWAPRAARQRAKAVSAVSEDLTSRLCRTPTQEETAAAAGLSIDALREAYRVERLRVHSLDDASYDHGATLRDDAPTPEAEALVDERLRYLRAAVVTLPVRLRYVVEQLFFVERSVSELASELGLHPSRISQLRTEALMLMRDGLHASLDTEMLPAPGATTASAGGAAARRRREYYEAVAQRATEQRLRRPVRSTVPTQVGRSSAAGHARKPVPSS